MKRSLEFFYYEKVEGIADNTPTVVLSSQVRSDTHFLIDQFLNWIGPDKLVLMTDLINHIKWALKRLIVDIKN